MMPAIYANTYEENDDLNTPVVALKEALPLSDLLRKNETEFEVRPEEDEGFHGDTSAEAMFNFNEVEKQINLDLIDFDETVDGEDGSPFDKYRRKMTNLREDGKIMKHTVKCGFGSTVPDNSLVYIRYQAYVEYQEYPFDSTLWQSNSEGDFPVPVNLGKGQLILGLHEAILSMKKGEKSEFLIHPDLAYGQLGCPPRIPQEATVLFIVEVDRFVDCGDIHTNNDDLSMEERAQFSNVYKIAKGHYLLANEQFKQKNYSTAANKYRQVINMMHNSQLANEEEEQERNRFLIKNYTNAAVTYHLLKNYKRVCLMAVDAIRVSESGVFKNSKLLYFWGYAKMVLCDFEGAKKHLLAAKKLKPQDLDIANALAELERKKKEAKVREKMMAQRAFQFKPEAAKITELDDPLDGFKKTITEQLVEFKNNQSKDVLTLTDRFTVAEENLIIQLAKDAKLYARVADGEKRVISIRKP